MPYTHQGPALYLASDQQTIVPADDPRAAFLLIAPGGTLPDEVAQRYGLPQAAAQLEPEKAEKAEQPKPNKARQPRENKAA